MLLGRLGGVDLISVSVCACTSTRTSQKRRDQTSHKSSAVAEMGDRLATIDMGRKVEGCAPFRGELGPYLTQCRLGRGLPPYQVAS